MKKIFTLFVLLFYSFGIVNASYTENKICKKNNASCNIQSLKIVGLEENKKNLDIKNKLDKKLSNLYRKWYIKNNLDNKKQKKLLQYFKNNILKYKNKYPKNKVILYIYLNVNKELDKYNEFTNLMKMNLSQSLTGKHILTLKEKRFIDIVNDENLVQFKKNLYKTLFWKNQCLIKKEDKCKKYGTTFEYLYHIIGNNQDLKRIENYLKELDGKFRNKDISKITNKDKIVIGQCIVLYYYVDLLAKNINDNFKGGHTYNEIGYLIYDLLNSILEYKNYIKIKKPKIIGENKQIKKIGEYKDKLKDKINKFLDSLNFDKELKKEIFSNINELINNQQENLEDFFIGKIYKIIIDSYEKEQKELIKKSISDMLQNIGTKNEYTIPNSLGLFSLNGKKLNNCYDKRKKETRNIVNLLNNAIKSENYQNFTNFMANLEEKGNEISKITKNKYIEAVSEGLKLGNKINKIEDDIIKGIAPITLYNELSKRLNLEKNYLLDKSNIYFEGYNMRTCKK